MKLDFQSLSAIEAPDVALGAQDGKEEIGDVSPRTTNIDELRRAYIHKRNENTQLKQRIAALEAQLEQRGEHAHNLETRIKSMEGNMQSMEDNLQLERKTHCAKMTNLV